MSLTKSIKRNSIFSFVSSSARVLANFIVFLAIARQHGEEAFGQFTLAHTFATIFLLFADFGFDVLLTTEIARERDKAVNYFRQYFSLKLVFSLAAVAGMWIIAFTNNLSQDARTLIFLFSFFMLFTALTNFISALYKGFEKLEYETYVSVINNVGLLVIIIILLILNTNLITISIGFVFSRLLGITVSIMFSRRVLPEIKYSLIFSGFKKVQKKVFVFGFHLLFVALYFQIDTVLLGYLKGDAEVGVYQAVFKIILLPLIIIDMLTNALTPVLTRLHEENRDLWEKLSYYFSKILLFIVLPITLIFFIYPEQIVSILYGKNNFLGAIPIFRVFAFTLFVRFTFEIFALDLTTSNNQHIRMWVAISATIINVVLNIIVIPKYGSYGAAVVSLITNLFVSLIYVLFYYQLFRKWFFNFKILFSYTVSFIIGLLFWEFKEYSIFICAPIIVLIFLIIGYSYYFTKEEKKNLFTLDFGFSELNKN